MHKEEDGQLLEGAVSAIATLYGNTSKGWPLADNRGVANTPVPPSNSSRISSPFFRGQRERGKKDSTDISVYLTDLAGFFLSKDLVFPSREDSGYLLAWKMVLSGKYLDVFG